MKPNSRKQICCTFFVISLAVSLLLCGSGEALIIPSGYTLVAENNFVGSVTGFTYSGLIQNASEVSIGSQVNGTYALAYNQNGYIFESDVSIRGKSGTYNSTAPGSTTWLQLTFSPDNKNLQYVWSNGYPTDLFNLFFVLAASADGGTISFDINNYASGNFSGTGRLYYETYSVPPSDYTGLSKFDVTFTVEPDTALVPEPSTFLLLGGGLIGLLAWRRKAHLDTVSDSLT